MNLNVIKLWKAMLHLSEVSTDKGTLIIENELAEGVEVFVEDENGEYVPAADGEYEAEDKIIVVADGKVTEIRDKEAEESEEQEPESTESNEELSARDRFNAVKERFEASYQEIEQNIYAALDAAGVWGYLLENSNDYAVVSEWNDEDGREHLFRYDITIAEDGTVTLGEKKEVRVEYVPVDEEPEATETESEEIAARDARIAELEKELAEKQEQLEMSADKPAKEKVKTAAKKEGALKYFV